MLEESTAFHCCLMAAFSQALLVAAFRHVSEVWGCDEVSFGNTSFGKDLQGSLSPREIRTCLALLTA